MEKGQEDQLELVVINMRLFLALWLLFLVILGMMITGMLVCCKMCEVLLRVRVVEKIGIKK